MKSTRRKFLTKALGVTLLAPLAFILPSCNKAKVSRRVAIHYRPMPRLNSEYCQLSNDKIVDGVKMNDMVWWDNDAKLWKKTFVTETTYSTQALVTGYRVTLPAGKDGITTHIYLDGINFNNCVRPRPRYEAGSQIANFAIPYGEVSKAYYYKQLGVKV